MLKKFVLKIQTFFVTKILLSKNFVLKIIFQIAFQTQNRKFRFLVENFGSKLAKLAILKIRLGRDLIIEIQVSSLFKVKQIIKNYLSRQFSGLAYNTVSTP